MKITYVKIAKRKDKMSNTKYEVMFLDDKSLDELLEYKKGKLVEYCDELELEVSGSKNTLAKRIHTHFNSVETADDNNVIDADSEVKWVKGVRR